ncbi:trafficking protein particle complex subunit 6b isoform X1 [Mastacembelus armatus]|uniref:trafficking protein particle complex subunit 6b isoform X1 n=1 Tax=Mastacembelus armatus TaxID=205130 RepID=UPI000E456699|nr:trafficking protein particle complex subunit 6b isoform X1 [Mastacembelus armatus]
MADEAPFQFLHNEVIQYIYKSSVNGETENGRKITKLENMGFRVGQGLIERCRIYGLDGFQVSNHSLTVQTDGAISSVGHGHGLTKDTVRFKDELDIMKFICKDFWTCVFKKQIDNLRTNHQGIYVLQDNKFRLLNQLSAGKQYLEHAPEYLAFTCGLVRGALSSLGVKSIVTAEVSIMPACKFQVMIQKI